MRNLLPTFSPAYASAMRRGFLRLRGFCAPSPVAQAAAFRPAAVSPAPTFFAVRRFVRFIQPAPNPALKRTCAKSRAARLALRWVRSFPLRLSSAHAQPASHFQPGLRFGHAPWVFAVARLLRAVACRPSRCVSSCRRITSADFLRGAAFRAFYSTRAQPGAQADLR